MKTLFLTDSEQSTFHALPDSLREGWIVEPETLAFEDTPQKRMIRLSLLRLHDPVLLSIRDQSLKLSNIDEMSTLIGKYDLKNVEEDDVAELFFALGPNILSHLIEEMMQSIQMDKDIEGVTALTFIRHSILAALQPVSQ